MKNFYRLIIILFVTLASQAVYAQVQDPLSPGYDENYVDSTSADSAAADSYNGEYGSNNKKDEEPINPFLKPYERILLPFDSVTNLITYAGVVEQEESGSDSLYIRAKRWAEKTFDKGAKIETDKRNQKITYVATIPAYSYINSYNKRLIGSYEFKFTVLIKEGRYKYMINNLVHESVKPASGKGTRNYFEYYYTTNTNVQVSDRVLRFADKELNQLIAGFKKAMSESIIIDEDEW